MDYNSISINPYIKSQHKHKSLYKKPFRTTKGNNSNIVLAPGPYFYVKSICFVYTNMFAKFDEIPAMTLQNIKETKRYRRTHGQRENITPSINKVCGEGGGGINIDYEKNYVQS